MAEADIGGGWSGVLVGDGDLVSTGGRSHGIRRSMSRAPDCEMKEPETDLMEVVGDVGRAGTRYWHRRETNFAIRGGHSNGSGRQSSAFHGNVCEGNALGVLPAWRGGILWQV